MNSALQQRAEQLLRSGPFKKALSAHSSTLKGGEISTAIHTNDQMLAHSLKHHRDANAAVSQYFNVALQQYNTVKQIREQLFGHGHNTVFLDFACGFGRLLRFLTHDLDQITASEIQLDALDYVQRQFAVSTVPSCANPEQFVPPGSYHMVWVASLFSHLPEALFKQWLERLFSLVKPDGVLCFSVHDACLLGENANFPHDKGFLYYPQSENADLDSSIYGNTFVNEAFVKKVIQDTLGKHYPVHRIPRGLAHEQDVYIVGGGNVRSLEPLNQFRRGAWGWVDERSLSPETGLYLRGWAACLEDGPMKYVDIEIEGNAYQAPTGLAREDVGQAFKDPRLNTSGWEFSLPFHKLPQGLSSYLTVSAQTSRGEKALLYTGNPGYSDRPMPLGLAGRIKQFLAG